jgi:hypothetical protein
MVLKKENSKLVTPRRVPLPTSGGGVLVSLSESELARFASGMIAVRDKDECNTQFKAISDERADEFSRELHNKVTIAMITLGEVGTAAQRLQKMNADIDAIRNLSGALQTALTSGAFDFNSPILGHALLHGQDELYNEGKPDEAFKLYEFFHRIKRFGDFNQSPLWKLRFDLEHTIHYCEKAKAAHFPKNAPRGADTTKRYTLALNIAATWKEYIGEYPPTTNATENDSFACILEVINRDLLAPLALKRDEKNPDDFNVNREALHRAIREMDSCDTD